MKNTNNNTTTNLQTNLKNENEGENNMKREINRNDYEQLNNLLNKGYLEDMSDFDLFYNYSYVEDNSLEIRDKDRHIIFAVDLRPVFNYIEKFEEKYECEFDINSNLDDLFEIYFENEEDTDVYTSITKYRYNYTDINNLNDLLNEYISEHDYDEEIEKAIKKFSNNDLFIGSVLNFNDDYELILEVDITDNKSFLDYYNYKTNFKISYNKDNDCLHIDNYLSDEGFDIDNY